MARNIYWEDKPYCESLKWVCDQFINQTGEVYLNLVGVFERLVMTKNQQKISIARILLGKPHKFPEIESQKLYEYLTCEINFQVYGISMYTEKEILIDLTRDNNWILFHPTV